MVFQNVQPRGGAKDLAEIDPTAPRLAEDILQAGRSSLDLTATRKPPKTAPRFFGIRFRVKMDNLAVSCQHMPALGVRICGDSAWDSSVI